MWKVKSTLKHYYFSNKIFSLVLKHCRFLYVSIYIISICTQHKHFQDEAHHEIEGLKVVGNTLLIPSRFLKGGEGGGEGSRSNCGPSHEVNNSERNTGGYFQMTERMVYVINVHCKKYTY